MARSTTPTCSRWPRTPAGPSWPWPSSSSSAWPASPPTAALYWVGGQTQWEGVFLGVGLFGFGFGLSAWGKYLLPQGPFVEDRHPFASSEPDIEAMTAAVVDRGTMVVRRRGFLGGLLAAGSGIMGIVLAFPLLRSLGPTPKKSLDTHQLDGPGATWWTSPAAPSTAPTSKWAAS